VSSGFDRLTLEAGDGHNDEMLNAKCRKFINFWHSACDIWHSGRVVSAACRPGGEECPPDLHQDRENRDGQQKGDQLVGVAGDIPFEHDVFSPFTQLDGGAGLPV
jgi:hypothetical protein